MSNSDLCIENLRGEATVKWGHVIIGKFVRNESGWWFVAAKDKGYDLRLSAWQLQCICKELRRLDG